MLCSACSFENPDGFRFCGRCGASLSAAGAPAPMPAAPPPAPAVRSPDAERRQITLLFCDLVGSTTLGEQFDPEELREIVQGYQAVCASAVAPYGGHIAQYLGDGILIYFGYPVTSEDSPRRAVHAGLAILEGIARLNERVASRHPLRLAVRVGIHTGAVVTGAVGGAGRTEQLAIGSAPNIAARLQSLAEPDTVVLSGTTYRLVEGFFEFKPLGLHQLKGLSHSVEVYRAIRSTGAVSRFEVIASRGLVPLVGREAELATLVGGFERARNGAGQTIAVVGEPGIGKSRLVEMFRERLSAQPHRWLMSRCSPYASRSALKPVVDTLENLCGIDRATPPAVRRENLTRFLAAFPAVKPDAGALLGALLALPPAPDSPALSLSPERQRQRTLEVLVELVLGSASQTPLVFAVEDVHWADPSTLELLALLAERTPKTHLLLLVLHRPGTVLPWARNEDALELPLSRLRDEHVAAIIGHVTAGREIPPGLLQQLVAKTDGVPLFVEELTKMVLESGQDLTQATGLAIPTTLHDSLVARLDHLGSAKEVAQVGAVLGREFSFEMLRAVATHDDATLAAALQTLVESDLIQQHGEAPATVYVFKHALVQDAAYGLMVAAVRQQHHRRAAEVIEARFASLAETQPELLARHFTEAAAFEPAVRYWLKAAQHANARSANLESIDHATRGLDLLRRLPTGPERSGLELGLQITLGSASLTRKGYWAKEVESAFARALELCEQLGDAARRSRALMGLWSYHVVRGDYANGLTLAERLVTEAERQEGTAPRVHALYCLGFTRYYVADFGGALDALSRAAAIPVREGDPALTMTTGDDVRVHVLVKRGMAAWHLGQIDNAVAWCNESIALARRIGHPYGIAFTLTLSSVVRMYRREPEPARLLAAEAVAIARDKGHSFLSAVSTFVLGWAAAESTDAGSGYAQMRGGRDALRAAGALVGQTMFSAILADVALRRGRADLGVTALADLETILPNGERHFAAEALRLRGQLNGHEDLLRRALETANAQGNRCHAVRAASALAEVLAQHQRKPEAQAILATALSGMTEGLDTPDLNAAASLLRSLS